MDSRITCFLERATAAQLKEKLDQMGIQTTGNKAVVKLRLGDAIRDLSADQLEEYFPRNVLLAGLSEPSNDTCTANMSPEIEHENLDIELETLREKLRKKQEILEIKKKLQELSEADETTSVRPHFNFRDIEESLATFSGEGNYRIQKWVQQFEETADLLGWDEKSRFIYARRLLTGTAKLFLQTITITSSNDLKQLLIREFDKKISSAEIHSELRKRKKKSDETYQQYVFAMQGIGSLADVDEGDVIYYIINGINDSTVNKLILYGANNIEELKRALQKYEKIKSSGEDKTKEKCDQQQIRKPKFSSSKVKCFNCNRYGHGSAQCSQPKRDKGSCFRCGKMGHRANNCVEQASVMLCADDPVGGPKTNETHEPEEYVYSTNNFEFNVRYAFSGYDDPQVTFDCILPTLLDSGSPISFMQQKYLPAYLMSPVQQDKYSFSGINDSILNIVGLVNVKIHFRNSMVVLKLFVVGDNTMRYPIILGRNFIDKSNLELKEKTSNKQSEIEPQENENLQAEASGIVVEDTGMTNDYCNQEIFDQILNIDVFQNNNEVDVNINEHLPHDTQKRVRNILQRAFLGNQNIDNCNPKINYEFEIKVTKEQPFY